MIKPSFQQLLYSQSLDTWVVSGVAQVDALVDEVYQQFLGHELKNNSRKTKSTLKTILLNLFCPRSYHTDLSIDLLSSFSC